MTNNIKKLTEAYKIAKEAKVGTQVKCASCGTSFEKTNYQQAFCKSKGGTICKDNYWNNVTPNKRNNQTRISPANLMWQVIHDTPAVLGFGDSQRAIDKQDRETIAMESDGSWDEHQCHVERCRFCECLICRCED